MYVPSLCEVPHSRIEALGTVCSHFMFSEFIQNLQAIFHAPILGF